MRMAIGTDHAGFALKEELDEALRQWEHGSEYRVEIVIASLYWTDASAGRAQQQQRGGWM